MELRQGIVDFQSITLGNGIIVDSGKIIAGSCEIKNAQYGVYISTRSDTIYNCNIHNCSYGVYMVNVVDFPNYTHLFFNNIHDNNYGLFYTNAVSTLTNNKIYNNTSGVYCYNSSSPVFFTNSNTGFNCIYENSMEGIVCSNYSNPELGRSSLNTGYNKIAYNTDVNLFATNNCNIMAQKDFWENPFNASKIYAANGSSVNFSDSITYDPCQGSTGSRSGSPLKSSASVENNLPQQKETGLSLLTTLYEARNQLRKGDIKTVYDLCKEIITSYPDSAVSLFALSILREAGVQYNKAEFLSFLSTLINGTRVNTLTGLAEIMLADYNKAEYIKRLDAAIAKYKGKSIVEQMLYGKFVYYFHEQSDTVNAKLTENKIDELFKGSMSSRIAHELMAPAKQAGKANTDKSVKEKTDQMPKEYALEQNYPNPFNPTTTINYSVPVDSKVKLTIYNNLGQVVRILVDEVRATGNHSAVFNAGKMASGVYFYSLTAQSLDGSRKDFQSNRKMLLLK